MDMAINRNKVKCRVYLSRRNLLTLLSKLDRKAAGQDTKCTLVKRDTQHPVFPQTMKAIEVVAVEDQAYYTLRPPGSVCDLDSPDLAKTRTIRLKCTEDDVLRLRRMAHRLREVLGENGVTVKVSAAYEALAYVMGFENWNCVIDEAKKGAIRIGPQPEA